MKRSVRLLAASLATTLAMACQTSAAPTASQPPVISPDCPPSLQCVINPPAFVDAFTTGDGTYNYTPVDKAGQQQPRYGIVLHTTESTTESVVSMSKTAPARSSWNYLMKPDGSVQQSVPLNAVAYNSANRYFNTGYVQIEIVGHAGLCDVTPQQYHAIGELGRYLAQRFNFALNVATVIGHDNVPGISDKAQSGQHWDPGVCFDWPQVFASMGVPAIQPDNLRQAGVVTVVPPFKQNDQPVSDCTDGSQCQPDQVRAYGLNFATVYSGPSEQAPLIGDPYLHPDAQPGTAALNNWGSKAPYGHSYAVAQRERDWTGLWFAGQIGWIQNKYLAPVSQPAKLVKPKNGSTIVYGRPMPSHAEFDASDIPDAIWQAQAIPADITKYNFAAGQAYPVAPATVVNAFYEGCDKTSCTAPGDGTIVNGSEEYLMIDFGHRFAFVKSSEVSISNS